MSEKRKINFADLCHLFAWTVTYIAIIYSGCIYVKYISYIVSVSCLVQSPTTEQQGSTGSTIAIYSDATVIYSY